MMQIKEHEAEVIFTYLREHLHFSNDDRTNFVLGLATKVKDEKWSMFLDANLEDLGYYHPIKINCVFEEELDLRADYILPLYKSHVDGQLRAIVSHTNSLLRALSIC